MDPIVLVPCLPPVIPRPTMADPILPKDMEAGSLPD